MAPFILLNDIKLILERAQAAPSLVGSTVEDAVAYADSFDVFYCVWLDLPKRYGHGLELVKAAGGNLLAGGKVRSLRSGERSFGAAFVDNRDFALAVAKSLSS